MKKMSYICDSCHSEFDEKNVYDPYGTGAVNDFNITFRSGDSCIETHELVDICLCKKCADKLNLFIREELNIEC